MKKLDTPRSLKSRFGPVTATHELHEFNVHLRPGNEQVVSTKRLVAETDGELVPLDEVQDALETVVISGDELKALGPDFKVSDVLKAHEKIAGTQRTQREKEIHQRQQALEQQIRDTEAQLKNLKSQKA